MKPLYTGSVRQDDMALKFDETEVDRWESLSSMRVQGLALTKERYGSETVPNVWSHMH